MLTTTEPRDLIAEIRTLASLTNDVLAIAEYITGDVYIELWGPQGKARLLEPYIGETSPGKPESPILTVSNALCNIKTDMDKGGADLETQGGEVYSRLLRIADMLELAH